MSDTREMGFFDHLIELRVRVINSVVALFFGFVVAYIFSKDIFRYLRGPFDLAYRNVYGEVPLLV